MGRMILLFATLLALPARNFAAEPARVFAAVVHQSNPTHTLHVHDLLALFDGASRRWSDGSAVVLVERDTGSAPLQYLLGSLLNTTPGEYKRRLQNIEYRGDAPVAVKILNSDAAACLFVFNVPSAIAIIDGASLGTPACGQVQVLRIEGKLPAEEGYRLR